MKKILLVDDDLIDQKFLERFLSKYYKVDTCSNVEQFYELTGKKVYDLILMDLKLKDEKTGIELTAELRNRKEFKNVPVIAITGSTEKEDQIESLQAGITHYIIKPIDYPKLVEKIKDLLKRKTKSRK